MNTKEKLEKYFQLQEEIYQYFDYKEDWVVIPIADHLTEHWMITGPEDSSSTSVVWSPRPFTKDSIQEGSDIYSGTIYTQRFLSKWVYRKEDLTMICVDTHTDGNHFLMIFDNNKECVDPELKEYHSESW
jgi:hypothetical protein